VPTPIQPAASNGKRAIQTRASLQACIHLQMLGGHQTDIGTAKGPEFGVFAPTVVRARAGTGEGGVGPVAARSAGCGCRGGFDPAAPVPVPGDANRGSPAAVMGHGSDCPARP